MASTKPWVLLSRLRPNSIAPNPAWQCSSTRGPHLPALLAARVFRLILYWKRLLISGSSSIGNRPSFQAQSCIGQFSVYNAGPEWVTITSKIQNSDPRVAGTIRRRFAVKAGTTMRSSRLRRQRNARYNGPRHSITGCGRSAKKSRASVFHANLSSASAQRCRRSCLFSSERASRRESKDRNRDRHLFNCAAKRLEVLSKEAGRARSEARCAAAPLRSSVERFGVRFGVWRWVAHAERGKTRVVEGLAGRTHVLRGQPAGAEGIAGLARAAEMARRAESRIGAALACSLSQPVEEGGAASST